MFWNSSAHLKKKWLYRISDGETLRSITFVNSSIDNFEIKDLTQNTLYDAVLWFGAIMVSFCTIQKIQNMIISIKSKVEVFNKITARKIAACLWNVVTAPDRCVWLISTHLGTFKYIGSLHAGLVLCVKLCNHSH